MVAGASLTQDTRLPDSAEEIASYDPAVLDQAEKKHGAGWWLRVFVIFHIVAITSWALPWPPADIQSGKRKPVGTDWVLLYNMQHIKTFPPTHAYLLSTGFWQYWDMFAPEPADTDFYCTADVTYRDGRKETYKYPRMYDLSIPDKFLEERFRKFFERGYDSTRPYMWARIGQRIALLMDKYPNNPPVQVDLFKNYRHIAGPGNPQPANYTHERYYQYIVDLGLLSKEHTGLP